MATETAELLLKFTTQGVNDIGGAGSVVEKLGKQAEQAGKQLKDLPFDEFLARSRAMAAEANKAGDALASVGAKVRGTSDALDDVGTRAVAVGGKFANLASNVVEVGLAAGLIAAGIASAVKLVGDLYNEYDPVLVAQRKSLEIVQATTKEYEKLIKRSDDLRLKELERTKGKEYVLLLEAGASKLDALESQRKIEALQKQIQELDKRISDGTSGNVISDGRGGTTTVPGLRGSLSRDAQVAQAQRQAAQSQLENALKALEVQTQESTNAEAESARIRADKAKQASDKMAATLAAIQRAYESLLLGLTKADQNQLVRFQLDYASRFADLSSKISPQQRSNLDATATEAVRRLLAGDGFSPTETFRQFRGLNSKGTGLAISGFTAPPLEQREEKISAEALKRVNDQIADVQKDVSKYKQQEVDAAIRLVELGDNEYQNAVRVRDIRLATAENDVEQRKAQLDFQVRIAEIEKQRIEKYQEQARGVYRSLRQGGTSGLGAFIRGQADQVAEQLFVNVAGQTFQRFGGALGKAGGASGLPDWLLKGTLLDPQNDQKLSLDTNTAATDRNTAAMDRTAAALTSGGGGGFNLSLPGGGGGGSIFDGFDPATGKWAKGTPGTGLSGWQRVAGYGTAIAGGAFGVASGVREGGFGGGLTAGSAGLGATAGILSLAGVSGPAAPILAGIGIGLAVIKAFIPDAAKTFYAEQDKLIASRQFTAPDAMSRGLDFATGGTPIEANFRGQSRVIVNHVVTLNVQALDAQSIMDRKDDLADAVAAATAGGSIPMTAAINQTVFGAGG